MTTPGAGAPDRGLGASTRSVRAPSAVPALTILLLAALALRLIIAYVLLPKSGFESDLGTFTAWAFRMVEVGAAGFYDVPGLSDYPPAYMLVLGFLGRLGQIIGAADGTGVATTTALLKMPPILADIATGALLYVVAMRWFGDRPRGGQLALLAAALYVFNPVTWYDSAIWGQVDAIGALLTLAMVALLVEGHEEAATAVTVLAGLAKPQYGVVLVPLLAVVLLRRHLLLPGSGPRVTAGPSWYRRWCEHETGIWRLVSSAAVGASLLVVVVAPFGLDMPGLIIQYGRAAGTYAYLTVNALNPWALVGSGDQSAMVEAGLGRWPSDTIGLIGPVPGVVIGTVLLVGGFVVGLALLVRRDERLTILLAAAYLCLAFFMLPTRVHERYLFPVFSLLPLLAILDRRYLVATVILAISTFVNLHAVLSSPIWATPNLDDFFFGPDFRATPVLLGSVFVTTGVFLFLLWQVVRATLRTDASVIATPLVDMEPAALDAPDPMTAPSPSRDEPARVPDPTGLAALGAVVDAPWLEEVRPRPEPVALAPSDREATATRAAAVVTMGGDPAGSAEHDDEGDDAPLLAGLRSAVRRQVGSGLRRRDRSAELAGEPPGRIDRLDVFVALLLLVSALTLRGWRVEEPYDMYFDEVYHARTATEFLQHWRYGEPHAIYEYTHPHLAKYLMAAGIVLFGDDEVSATSALGFAPRDAVIERRWDAVASTAGRAGDRLYVSGDGGVRAFDLAGRQLVTELQLDGAQPKALAIDETSHRLVISDMSGGLWTLDTRYLDDVRAGDDPTIVPSADRLGDLGAPVQAMIVDDTGERLTAVLDDGRVAIVDLADGTILAEAAVPGAADAAATTGGQRLVVDVGAVDEPGSLAETLAGILADDATRIRALLVGAEGVVTVVSNLEQDEAINIQEALDQGELPGTTIESGDLVAVAATEGLVLLDAATLARVDAIATDAPVTSVVHVEGPAEPTLYGTTGERLLRVEVKKGQAPVKRDDVWMPAAVYDLVYDSATQMLHVLGRTPDGDASTVYVVEPHANAVYADALLPAPPVAWALDADADRPSQDRQQLLTIAADGQVAVVETGRNAFGWRLPGVILGALTAALIYLLARVLIRRRTVGLAVAGLVLVDGMMFAQSRIGMNDVYVGAFIAAAYLVFALLWLGRWRGWSALLVGLPLLGVILGLALAAKWVGLYAIGGIVLLILIRSAVGRLIALAALIAMTGVLGWVAISSPTSSTPDVVGTIVVTILAMLLTGLVLHVSRAGRTVLLVGLVFAAVAAPILVSVKGNGVFVVITLAVTLLLAVAIVLRPVRWSRDEARFAVAAPVVLGIVGTLLLVAASSSLPSEGMVDPTTLLAASLGLVAVGVLAYIGLAMAASRGRGPLAPTVTIEPAGGLPAGQPPRGWLRPGWRFGLPWLWALGCVLAIPVVVYVISFAPWVELGNRWIESFPAGNEGQTLLALQIQMYEYHDNLRATHAASSPWWAWPFDLKPVWFYLGNLAEGWTAVIYDAGNLVLFWLSVPAMIWLAFTAWHRRSLALALVLIGFACQWLPWARIDRATFQYHYYTSLPFVIIGLAYFLAELWHGPSARTWLLARVSVAAMLVAVPLLWLLRVPLCAVSGVAQVNPGSQACGYVSEAFVLTERAAVSLLIVLVGIVILAWQAHTLGLRRRRSDFEATPGGRLPPGAIWLLITAVTTGVAVAIVQSRFAETPLVTAPIGDIGPYVGALLLGLPLAVAAWLVIGARDPRRFIIGTFGAMIIWFVAFQPTIAALPVPTGLARLFQTLPLSTYNYDFQFAVNTAGATETSFLSLESVALTAMVACLAGAAMYAAAVWRSGGWAPGPDEDPTEGGSATA
ncbi:MAG TPA: phospholipid carrier-dependent glycosyltransferase [Candidatus Limnocylindrales bacterium]